MMHTASRVATATSVAIIVNIAVVPGRAAGDVIAVQPFQGAASDTFDQYSRNMSVQTLPVFDGLGVIENQTQGGAIKVEWASQFSGKWVRPISGMMMGQLGIGQWTFDVPVTRFGGWWENNSGVDDATVEFFDIGGNLLGTHVANVPFRETGWTWNGWESDIPIHRLVVTGNGVLNGFLWYENMQIDYVPAPAGFGLLLLAGLGGSGRRRR